MLRYIADFVSGVPKTGVDDIINYFSLEKLGRNSEAQKTYQKNEKLNKK